MGSPISSVIASLVLEELENETTKSLDYVPHFYKRYVDCILCITENKLETHMRPSTRIMQEFSSQLKNKKKVPLMIRIFSGRSIITKKLKPIGSRKRFGQKSIWNFSQKSQTSLRRSLTERAIRLAHVKRPKNIKIISDAFRANNYPSNFIELITRKITHQLYNNSR